MKTCLVVLALAACYLISSPVFADTPTCVTNIKFGVCKPMDTSPNSVGDHRQPKEPVTVERPKKEEPPEKPKS